jgi:uncharacterized BrkB/YihY/UPF0761 family membrane protein
MSHLGAKIRTSLIDLAWCFGVTALFFAPIRFYYSGYFGILQWLVFSDEGAPVRFFPGRLALSILLWIVCLILISRWLKYLDSPDYLSGPTSRRTE